MSNLPVSGGEERRGGVPDLRTAGASGRIALRWTSALYARELNSHALDRLRRSAWHGASGGVRLLVAPDLRVFGQDRLGLFTGPGMKWRPPLYDSFHPNGVVVGGEIIGAWGRRAGRVKVKIQRPLPEEIRAAITAEALSMPIPDAVPSIEITQY